MSIFFWVVVGKYTCYLLALALAAVAILVANLGRRVLYQAGIDMLELRARWRGQDLDREQQRLALDINSQAQRLQLAAGHGITLDQARWVLEHQHDVEVEPAPGDRGSGEL